MSKISDIKHTYFLNVRFDHIDLQFLTKNMYSMADEGPCYIVTPNVDHVIRLNKHREFLGDIYDNAILSLCDSRVLKLIASLKGTSLPDVITGSDLTKQLFSAHFSERDRIAVIGGHSNTIDKLRNLHPKLSIDHYNPPMGFIHSELEVAKCLEFVANNEPEFLFIAVGSPRQEILANEIARNLPNARCLMFCIGASLLFITGDERRAPVAFQKLHLEWLFRMLHSPRRLVKRYIFNALGIASLIIKN